MRTKYLGWCLLAGLVGCNPERVVFVEPPPEVPSGYPAIAKFSEERYNKYVATWVRFATKYNLSLYPPPVDSVMMIPTRLANIDLFPDRTDTVTLEEAQSRLYRMIGDWPDLFNARLSELQDTAGRADWVYSRYYFNPLKKFPYGPITSNSLVRTMVVIMRHSGIIQTLANNCPPTLEIPSIINVDSVTARSVVMGKTLYYEDWGGKDSLVLSNLNMSNTVVAATLVERWPDSNFTKMIALEYRSAWKITTPIFDVYVDAITGEDLNYAEQTVIF